MRPLAEPPAEDIPPPGWSFFRESFENGPSGRPKAWRTVGCWAVDRLSERLGADWPERAYEKLGRLPAGMAWAGSHTAAYVELVELALRLELLCNCEGFARIRDSIKQDPREEQIPHLRLQLEVGALAQRAGYGVRFERPIDGGNKTSDVNIDLPDGQSLLVETRVLLLDEHSVAINRFTDRAFEKIHRVESLHDAQCDGELREVIDDEKLGEVVNAVEARARLVRAGAVAPPLRMHGATLVVNRRGTGPQQGLQGPALTGDLWPRIADRLDKKALQTQGAQNVWLRICALHGLWLFTDWATKSLGEKLTAMRHNIVSVLDDRPHVEGVVISSGSGWPQGTVIDEDHEDSDAGYAIRRGIPPIMARETLVVPLRADGETRSHAHVWRDLSTSEPSWLDYALAQFHLPSTAEIFESANPCE